MDFFDTLTLDGPRITSDGYLVASVKVARTGIQLYSGREVDPENKHGMRDKAQVRVYRSPEEVFSADSIRSFAYRPVTIDHPSEAVTADNWKDFSVGNTGGDVLRDGEFVRVPMVIMDAAAIKTVMDGKREISQGYTCDLAFEAGTTQDGLEYDVSQRTIRANHTAVVGLARGGPELRIGDSQVTLKMITVDGHQVEVSDAAAIAISGLQAKLADSETKRVAAETSVGTLTAAVSTKDGQITALTAQLADASMTPAKLDAAVAARAKVIDAAKKIFPAIVTDGKTDAAIRKEAVVHKIADAATMDDNGIIGAFTALAASVADAGTDTLVDGIKNMKPTGTQAKQVADAHAKRANNLTNAWQTPAAGHA
jgi:hypothetical protein